MKRHCFEVILEDINARLGAIIESIHGLNQRVTKVEKAIEPLPKIESEAEARKILFGVRDREIKDHELRITKLEVRT